MVYELYLDVCIAGIFQNGKMYKGPDYLRKIYLVMTLLMGHFEIPVVCDFSNYLPALTNGFAYFTAYIRQFQNDPVRVGSFEWI